MSFDKDKLHLKVFASKFLIPPPVRLKHNKDNFHLAALDVFSKAKNFIFSVKQIG